MRNSAWADYNDPIIESDNLQEEDYKNEYEADISHLNLSKKAENFLHRGNIFTIDELIKLSKKDLMSIRGIGKGIFEEIQKKLSEYNSNKKENGIIIEVIKPKIIISDESIEVLLEASEILDVLDIEFKKLVPNSRDAHNVYNIKNIIDSILKSEYIGFKK